MNGRLLERHYDAATNTITNTSPEGRVSTILLDERGRPIHLQTGALIPITLSYDAGRLRTFGRGTRQNTINYDANGNISAVVDANAQTLGLEHDDVGRVTKQTNPDLSEILYGYGNQSGNVQSVTPAGRAAHSYTYSAKNNETSYTPPQLVPPLPTTATSYSYTLDDEVDRITFPDGSILDHTYDSHGRLQSISLPSGEVRSFAYEAGLLVNASLDDPSTNGEEVTVAFTYDGPQPLTERWSGPGIAAIEVTRRFNDLLQLESLQVGSKDPIRLDYDGDGLLTSAGTLSLKRRQLDGLLESTAISGSTGKTVEETFGYNAFGELANRQVDLVDGPSIATLYALTLSRDSLGRVSSKIEATLGSPALTTEYRYDELGRLDQVKIDGVVRAEYAYDSNGNRIGGFTQAQGTLTSATYDPQDRLEAYTTTIGGAVAFTYSPNGTLLAKSSSGDITAYDYDAQGALRSVVLRQGSPTEEVVEYIIDPADRLIGRKAGGIIERQWVYNDGISPIAELDGSGTIRAEFVYGSQATVPDYVISYDASGNEITTYRIISDHLGSPRLAIDVENGTVTQEVSYDEFGIATLVSGTWEIHPFGFAGGIYDGATELVHQGARDYDPRIGRWTAKDPIRFQGQFANLYTYVGSDPINRTDPTGLQTLQQHTTATQLNSTLVNEGVTTLAHPGGIKSFQLIKRVGCFALKETVDVILEEVVYIGVVDDVDRLGGGVYAGSTTRRLRQRVGTSLQRHHRQLTKLLGVVSPGNTGLSVLDIETTILDFFQNNPASRAGKIANAKGVPGNLFKLCK